MQKKMEVNLLLYNMNIIINYTVKLLHLCPSPLSCCLYYQCWQFLIVTFSVAVTHFSISGCFTCYILCSNMCRFFRWGSSFISYMTTFVMLSLQELSSDEFRTKSLSLISSTKLLASLSVEYFLFLCQVLVGLFGLSITGLS